MKNFLLFLIVFTISTASTDAQSRRKPRKPTVAKPVAAKPETIPTAKTETLPPAPVKKNERAPTLDETADQTESKKANAGKPTKPAASAHAPFVYEFSNPLFSVTRVRIEHDSNGRGKITFERQDLDEPIIDPLQVSPAALDRIKKFYDELNFLDSTENYQSPERNYSHLGAMKLRRQEGEKAREAEFNWTENLTARALSEEYKKLTEQFVWIFEINVARENQPLEAPKLMDKLEGLVKQNRISDGAQILPFLRELADDERLPLIARNHATKIVKQIEKQKK